MDNNDIRQFGEALTFTLEPGDTDKNGKQYDLHKEYEAELDRQADKANVKLKKFDQCPF